MQGSIMVSLGPFFNRLLGPHLRTDVIELMSCTIEAVLTIIILYLKRGNVYSLVDWVV
jgi:hypothetical protein